MYEFNKEDFMIKRIFIVTIICLAALLTITVSLGMAQQGTTVQSTEPVATGQNESDGLVDPEGNVMNYFPVQGRLTDPSGSPLNGEYTIAFRLYSVDSGGTALCQDTNTVMVTNGLFSTEIWGTCAGFITGQQLYLGIEVNGDGEMSPRRPIFATPYAWSLRPGAVISGTIPSEPILHIENWGTGGRGLRVYAMSETGTNYGIVGASRSPNGFGGYFYNTNGGTALLATSANGVAIRADGVINSTAPTYLWVSGNDVRSYAQTDSTVINLNSHGGANILQGTDVGYKSVVLPITIPATLYGQDVKLTELKIYWQGDTSFESIVTMRLRRQTGACPACYVEIMADTADYTCFEDNNPQGCVITKTLTNNNFLSPDSGILYLTLELGFNGPSSWLDLGGARLTLEYDN
jgi:hypothetical protein